MSTRPRFRKSLLLTGVDDNLPNGQWPHSACAAHTSEFLLKKSVARKKNGKNISTVEQHMKRGIFWKMVVVIFGSIFTVNLFNYVINGKQCIPYVCPPPPLSEIPAFVLRFVILSATSRNYSSMSFAVVLYFSTTAGSR